MSGAACVAFFWLADVARTGGQEHQTHDQLDAIRVAASRQPMADFEGISGTEKAPRTSDELYKTHRQHVGGTVDRKRYSLSFFLCSRQAAISSARSKRRPSIPRFEG